MRFAAIVTLALLFASACKPQDRRPGLWLSGELVSEPVADWSFSDEHEEIFVETPTWYGIPHSVTTVCAALDGQLYVPSLFRGEQGYPEGKFWTRNVARDPRVRLKIGGRLYERQAALVTDEAEYDRVLATFARKYPFWNELHTTPVDQRPELIFLRMEARRDGD